MFNSGYATLFWKQGDYCMYWIRCGEN